MADEKTLNCEFAEALRHVPVPVPFNENPRYLDVQCEVDDGSGGRIDIKVGSVTIECAWHRDGPDGAIADAMKRDPNGGQRVAVWYDPDTVFITEETDINWFLLGRWERRTTVREFAEEMSGWGG